MEKTITVSLNELLPWILEQLEKGSSAIIAPYGTSMLPMLRQGVDKVELSPVVGKLAKYDLPLYRRANGKLILHRVVEVGETYTCAGDNQFTLEPGVRHEQIIAVVTGFYRKGRYHSVKEPGYKLYCKIWCFIRPVRGFLQRGLGWISRRLK